MAVVSGKNPQAVAPGVVNDLVHMSNGAFGESMRDPPRVPLILRRVDVDFVTLCIVKVFAEEHASIGCCGDVEWPRATQNPVRHLEFGFSERKGNDRSGNCPDPMTVARYSECVETVAYKAGRESVP